VEEKALIRISKIHEGSKLHLFVEGTLSDGWVEALETSWLEARSQLNDEPLRVDLSDITYVDDGGRELLARMIRCGVELRATGIMTRAVVEEIKEMIAREGCDASGGYRVPSRAGRRRWRQNQCRKTQDKPTNNGKWKLE
jgi:hypothetical protein